MMTDLRRAPAAIWLVTAAIGAAAAGIAVAQGHTAPMQLIATLALAVATIAAVVSPYLRLLCVFAAIPLDTYAKVLSRPIPATAFQFLLVVVLGSWLARVLFGRAKVHFGAAEAAASVVLVAAVWSLPFSLNASATMIGIQRIVLDTALFVLCVALLDTPVRMRRAALTLVATILVVAIYALAQYVFPGVLPGVTLVQGTLDRTTISRVAALFLDPNTLGGLTATAAAAFLALAAHSRSSLRVAAWLGAATVSLAAMVVTFSRGSWLAFVVALPIVVLTAPRERRRKMLVGLGMAALAAVLLAPGVIVARVGSAID